MDYRFSSYSIVVPLESEPDNVFMMHGYTGAIDVLSKEIADYLQNHKHFSKEEIPCSETTMEALEKRGYITKWSEEEEVEYAKRLANALYRKSCIINNSFTLVITYDCNFRCPYCYERGIEKSRETFTKETTDKLYKAILEIAPERKLRNNLITLYGGEPLLKENRDSVAYLVEEGIKRGFKFTAITNGFDLDSYSDLLSPNKIASLQVTIDGMPHSHNKKRIHRDGIPTFDKIVDNIGIALKNGISVSVRVNTDQSNIKDLKYLEELFINKKYSENKKFILYSALLRNHSDNSNVKYSYSQKEYINSLKELGIKCQHHDYGLSVKLAESIKHNKPIKLDSIFCTSQAKGCVMDPLGNIYPCWEVVNQSHNLIGNFLNEKISWNINNLMKWRQNFLTESGCINCKYAFICRGGCPAHQLHKKECTHIEDIVHHTVNRTYVSVINNKSINN